MISLVVYTYLLSAYASISYNPVIARMITLTLDAFLCYNKITKLLSESIEKYNLSAKTMNYTGRERNCQVVLRKNAHRFSGSLGRSFDSFTDSARLFFERRRPGLG